MDCVRVPVLMFLTARLGSWGDWEEWASISYLFFKNMCVWVAVLKNMCVLMFVSGQLGGVCVCVKKNVFANFCVWAAGQVSFTNTRFVFLCP